MKVFGHDYLSSDDEVTLLSHFLQNLQKDVPATRGTKKLSTAVATAGNEMPVAATMNPAQTFWHGTLL